MILRTLALLAALPLAAQGTLAVRAGKLLDVRSGKVLQDRVLLIRGERIEAVLDPGAALPAGTPTLDLSRCTVLPGLIDCHTHLVGPAQGASTSSLLENSSAKDLVWGIRNARTTLLAGFTSVRDVGTNRVFTDVVLRDAINDGTVPGPRMTVCGTYITATSGSGDITGLAPDVVVPHELRFGVADTEAEVRQRVRQLLNGGADFIKIMATGAVLTRGTRPGATELGEAELRAAVEEASHYGAKVTAHAHGAEGIKNAIRAGVQCVEHASLIDAEGIRMAVDRGTFLSMDIYNADYIEAEGRRQGWPGEFLQKNLDTAELQRQGFRKAVAAGARMVFGTDAGVYPHGLNARQFAFMVRYGMTPMQAVQAATLRAAENLGVEDRVGTLEPGRFADLVAVEGDLLADISKLEDIPYVMKGGVLVKGKP